MAGASTNRFGGNALLGGGVLFMLAGIFHPDVSTFEGATAANAGLWHAVHWAYLLGDVLLVAGSLVLFRHFVMSGGGANEGWASVAYVGGLMGFTLDAASTGIHLTGFPPALPASTPNLQGIFDAASAVGPGIGGIGVVLSSIGLAALGVVLKKEGWSAAVAYGAIVVGSIQVLLALIPAAGQMIPAGYAGLAVGALMPLGYAVVGASFAKVGAK